MKKSKEAPIVQRIILVDSEVWRKARKRL